jgi:hypothetical protein
MLSLVLNPKHVCSAPLTLLDWRLGARRVDTSDQCLVHLPSCCCTELPKACNYEWDPCLDASSGSSGLALPGVILLPTSFLQNSLHITMDTRGPAIDVFNFGGGRYRTCQQHLPGGLPSMSPTPVVAATGPAASNPQGARHRRLQLRWWLLLNLPPAPPRGPAIDVFNFDGGHCQTCR